MTDLYYKRTQTEKHFINEHRVTIVASADNMLPLAQRYKSVLVDARCIGNSEISFNSVGNIVLPRDSLAGACFPDLYEASQNYPLDKHIRLQMNDGVPCLMPHVANRFLSEKLTGQELTANDHRLSYKFCQYLPIHVVRKAARTAGADIAFVQLQGDCSTLDTYLAKGADLVLNPTHLFQRLIEKNPWDNYKEVGPWCYPQRAVLMQHDIVVPRTVGENFELFLQRSAIEGKCVCNHIVDCYLNGVIGIEEVKEALEKSKDLEMRFAAYKSACDSPEAWEMRNELVYLVGLDAVKRFEDDNNMFVIYKRQRV